MYKKTYEKMHVHIYVEKIRKVYKDGINSRSLSSAWPLKSHRRDGMYIYIYVVNINLVV